MEGVWKRAGMVCCKIVLQNCPKAFLICYDAFHYVLHSNISNINL